MNTDFAQTEVDQRQVNLTRFSHFFPERRDFFLDGAPFLAFGSPVSGDLIVNPFFSRRIGLTSSGTPQTINYGAKLTGQMGQQDVGFLHVRTGDDNVGIGEEFTVARVRRRILSQSSFGGVYTRRDPHGDAGSTRQTAGADFRLATANFRGSQFSTRLFRLVGEAQFSPYIALVNHFQYRFRECVLGWQSRFRWVVRPGSDVYFVYTHNWADDPLLTQSLRHPGPIGPARQPVLPRSDDPRRGLGLGLDGRRVGVDHRPLHGPGRQLHRHCQRLDAWSLGEDHRRLHRPRSPAPRPRRHRHQVLHQPVSRRPQCRRHIPQEHRRVVRAVAAPLQTDYIDRYWMHAWDRFTPMDETMRALDDLVRAGKVRYIGVSDMPAWKVTQAQMLADWKAWTPFVALQIEYSLIEHTIEGDLLPMAHEFGLGVTPWSPLRGGALSGKYTRANAGTLKADRGDRVTAFLDERTYTIIDELVRIADELGVTPAAVAIAWVQQRPGVTSTIIGARTLLQLEQNLAALDVPLTAAHTAPLDTASRPTLGFPHAFLQFASMISGGGTTVNGEASVAWPMAPKNDAERY